MATRRGPDNTCRFSVGGHIGTVAWANVFWAQLTYSTTPTQADLDAWLTAVSNAHKTTLAQHMATPATYEIGKAQLFLPGNGLLPSQVLMNGAGTGTATAGDSQATCEVISWTIQVYWRGGKPRTYLPFTPSSNMQGNNKLTTAAISALTTQALAFRTAVNGATSGPINATQLGTVSFRTGNAERVPPVFFPFVGAKVHSRVGTQRRRLGPWAP